MFALRHLIYHAKNLFIIAALKRSFCKKHQLEQVFSLEGTTEYLFCTKKCYGKVERALYTRITMGKGSVHWSKDGANGPNDPNTSLFILLTWWEENDGENYNRYKRRVSELAERMNRAGVKVHRTPKQVHSKIKSIEKQIREAYPRSPVKKRNKSKKAVGDIMNTSMEAAMKRRAERIWWMLQSCNVTMKC
jgi:hypothetical protein